MENLFGIGTALFFFADTCIENTRDVEQNVEALIRFDDTCNIFDIDIAEQRMRRLYLAAENFIDFIDDDTESLLADGKDEQAFKLAFFVGALRYGDIEKEA